MYGLTNILSVKSFISEFISQKCVKPLIIIIKVVSILRVQFNQL